MNLEVGTIIALKAKLLCEGVNADESVIELFRRQNPSGTKRGGLSSGGKMSLPGNIFVNAPFYQKRIVDLRLVADAQSEYGARLIQNGHQLCQVKVLSAPDWYQKRVGDFDITQIMTAHNRQLVSAVYEDCALFSGGRQSCQFCVINYSLAKRDPRLVTKNSELILAALEQIPVVEYGGLTLNGGMTVGTGRGMELIEPVVRAVHKQYPQLPIAVEMTPPEDALWIDRIIEAGVSSLMMNLECWDEKIRSQLIPGKNTYCPRSMYLSAFDRAIRQLGPGRVSTCFVVGTEPMDSLRQGITEVIRCGVMPSPLAGRYFEDVPNYPFAPQVNWREFLDILFFAGYELKRQGIGSTDQAGCVACGMCDLIKDI